MICAWQEFVDLLPHGFHAQFHENDRKYLQEFRIRINQPPELVFGSSRRYFLNNATAADISYIINAASRYSPWAASSVSQGYITGSGGHRIGICGDSIMHNDRFSGVKNPISLCIRIARDCSGVASNMLGIDGSVLIIGSPGSGKTTFLRDLIRQRSDHGCCMAVVDERGEIFPCINGKFCFPCGRHTDVLTGCPKPQGIDMLLRVMGPSCIAVDEITAQEDCNALIQAGWCGVELMATAHAANRKDLYSRPVYKQILQSGLFQNLIIIQKDKSVHLERMDV